MKVDADKLNKQCSCSHLRFSFTPVHLSPRNRKHLADLANQAKMQISGSLAPCNQDINQGHQNGQLNHKDWLPSLRPRSPGLPPWSIETKSSCSKDGFTMHPGLWLSPLWKALLKDQLHECIPYWKQDKAVRAYIIIHKQSDKSLAYSDLFDIFKDNRSSIPTPKAALHYSD